MANRIEAILEGRDVQPQNSYEAALKQHVASGGGSGGGVMVVDCTMNAEQQIIAGKTAGEIFNAWQNGEKVIFKLTVGTIALFMLCVSATNNYKSGVPYAFSVVLPKESGNTIVNFIAETSSDNPVAVNVK